MISEGRTLSWIDGADANPVAEQRDENCVKWAKNYFNAFDPFAVLTSAYWSLK